MRSGAKVFVFRSSGPRFSLRRQIIYTLKPSRRRRSFKMMQSLPLGVFEEKTTAIVVPLLTLPKAVEETPEFFCRRLSRRRLMLFLPLGVFEEKTTVVVVPLLTLPKAVEETLSSFCRRLSRRRLMLLLPRGVFEEKTDRCRCRCPRYRRPSRRRLCSFAEGCR
jgi:hypothetical protein